MTESQQLCAHILGLLQAEDDQQEDAPSLGLFAAKLYLYLGELKFAKLDMCAPVLGKLAEVLRVSDTFLEAWSKTGFATTFLSNRQNAQDLAAFFLSLDCCLQGMVLATVQLQGRDGRPFKVGHPQAPELVGAALKALSLWFDHFDAVAEDLQMDSTEALLQTNSLLHESWQVVQDQVAQLPSLKVAPESDVDEHHLDSLSESIDMKDTTIWTSALFDRTKLPLGPVGEGKEKRLTVLSSIDQPALMQMPSVKGQPTPTPGLPLQPARQFSASQETAFVPTTDGFGSVQGDRMQSSDFGGTDGDSLDWDAPWQGHPKPCLELPGTGGGETQAQQLNKASQMPSSAAELAASQRKALRRQKLADAGSEVRFGSKPAVVQQAVADYQQRQQQRAQQQGAPASNPPRGPSPKLSPQARRKSIHTQRMSFVRDRYFPRDSVEYVQQEQKLFQDPLPSMSWEEMQAVQGLGPAKDTDLDRVSSNPIKKTIMRATSLRRTGGSSRDALEQQPGGQGHPQAQPQAGTPPFRSPSYREAKPAVAPKGAAVDVSRTAAPVQPPAAEQAASMPVRSKKKSGHCCFGAPETKDTKTDALAAAARSHRQQQH